MRVLVQESGTNYDKFVETFDGKNTMHDTVGICYQLEDSNAQTEHSSDQTDTAVISTRRGGQGLKRRCTFDSVFLDV